MGEISVVLEGQESPTAARSLYSTVHGAGRVMSRTEAAGRVKQRTRWACTRRDCRRITPDPDVEGHRRGQPALSHLRRKDAETPHSRGREGRQDRLAVDAG